MTGREILYKYIGYIRAGHNSGSKLRLAINVAAWSTNCDLNYYQGRVSSTGRIRKDAGKKSIEVNGRSLDSLLEELNREIPANWIKIDVEGAELEVLRGLNKTLCFNSPRLFIEVINDNEVEFENYMHTLNYNYYIIPESIAEDLKYYYCWRNSERKIGR